MREFSQPPLTRARPVGGLADCVFDHAVEEPGRVVLARKSGGRWQDVTAAGFRDQVLAVAKGLLAEGIRFGDRVALMAPTRYEWTLLDFALWTVGAQVVPVYPTSSAEQVYWMLHDAQAAAAFVEHEDHAMTVGSVIDRLPHLRRLWQFDAGAEQELMTAGADIADEVVHRHRRAVTPDSVASVIYTSGTTGRPKGCVLTHGNFMFEADTLLDAWEPVFTPHHGEEASTLLFLPLAHVFGRVVEVAAVRGRVRFGHQPRLSADALIPELAAFRPSFVLAVPYIFEKIYRSAARRAEAEGRAGVFAKAVEVAVRYAEAREQRALGRGAGPGAQLRMQHQLYDKLVYARLRAVLGGRMRYAMSGGSAMDRKLGLFFSGAGLTVYEGYGLTESSAAATANPPGRARFGTVGRPLPGTAVRIAEDGEVWLRGEHVFQGYLNTPRSGHTALREGWLATGDIGRLDEDGYLTITGRKKEILVTSGGKSVSPGPLEDRVREHPLVAQCVVLGNDRPYVSALVTLDADAVSHWLEMRGQPVREPAAVVRDPELEREVRRAVVAANTQVSQAESIRTFRILARPFTEEQGLLTPSLKLKRKAIEETYAHEITALYRG
ncbi:MULTISPECIES: AMP-dependent synthetase/ligase [Streptomyces]|uniref:AMP-dependent synthetase/ligase n=1 Tax=Streptomyces TaxID=1883 RepID=UPI0001B58A1F|nr:MULTISPECIES: AMP-dependent synthetase/ligase [unclassified Streptomyces]EFL03577.1 O-succinylbenzoate-CoA ligase [Streptomyces sp. SPB78]MDT0422842.1 AMP-dependent synthetase/ligase [Streptomyces sp. DSM 41859]WEH30769.1 AMP-dependent synthetase/ligase [Streptomyces sp. AM 3-1-1]